MALPPEEMDEFQEWEARRKAARPSGGAYRFAWRLQSFVVGFWVLASVSLFALGEVEAALPFVGLAVVQGLVLLIVRRYRPIR